ncbi:MAG: prepilin-type N-terminal cleavage/methylation domain-containing protein [Kiritimatiellota bacterium]|nr:prepilin-type N-terminal cleavage/methylation domain-containing protein [Kiritimatiellota bacterium]
MRRRQINDNRQTVNDRRPEAGDASGRCLSFAVCCLVATVRRPSSVVRRPSSGFSLVEVTLALMVMAIGILSIMSLFPAGLDQNARSIADTHAAFFAEEVFAGLQARAETNWAELAAAQLPVAASDMWTNTNRVHVSGINVVLNKYEYNTYEDHALRYRLVLTTNGLLKAATLFVWPGEFGSTNDPSIFYAEFFRWKP